MIHKADNIQPWCFDAGQSYLLLHPVERIIQETYRDIYYKLDFIIMREDKGNTETEEISIASILLSSWSVYTGFFLIFCRGME